MSKDLYSVKNIPNPKWFGISIFVTTVIFYASQILPIIVLIFILKFSGRGQEQISNLFTDNSLVQFIAVASVAATSVFLVFKYLKWRGEKPYKFLMIKRKVPSLSQLGEVIVTYGLYFLTTLVATIVLSIISSIDVNQAQQLGFNRPETSLGLALIFVSLIILAPISEEIMFRGLLFNSLKKYGNKIMAFIFVSIIFGMAHLEYGNLNWIAVVDTLIFSVYLIYISQKHKSLYSSMLLHALKNSIAFYVLFVR